MTNNIIDKVRAEINRRIHNIIRTPEEEEELKRVFPDQYGVVLGYRAVLSIIDEMEKEPVSDDLEEEIERDFVMSIIEKEHRQPTFDDAIKYGMRLQRENMIKGAAEGYIRRNRYTKKNVLNGFDVTCDAIQKFNGGDKVKVIVIKED